MLTDEQREALQCAIAALTTEYADYGTEKDGRALTELQCMLAAPVPPAAASQPDERAAFEAWALGKHGHRYERPLLERREDGEYRNGLMRDLWPTWQARATAPQAGATLTDEQRKLIEAAAECISEAVTYDQDGFDSPPQPASQWDYNADQLAYALRDMLATASSTTASDTEGA